MADISFHKKTNLHVAMFPWFGFGHFTAFLHLANHLASRGHTVSFLLPRRTASHLRHLNRHPHLITFHPITVPHVDGLPPDAETTRDAPFPLVRFLFPAFDRTRDQVRSILAQLTPTLVIYDLAHWIPALGKERGFNFKAVAYVTVSAASAALRAVPSVKMVKGMTDADLMRTPPGYPASAGVLPRPDEIAQARFLAEDCGGGSGTMYERLTVGNGGSDAIALRTCRELEGQYCDYLEQQYGKPVLLTGPLLDDVDGDTSAADERRLARWLDGFGEGSVVYCAFGSENLLHKDQFQELLNGFELCGHPFLVALKPPAGCSSVEEAFPKGFEERVAGRGLVEGGWVPQRRILDHPSVGCFVSHCGFGSMWEGLLSQCQLVMVPALGDQIPGTMLLVNELKVAVEVEKDDDGWIAKEKLSEAVRVVMDGDDEGGVGEEVRKNHGKYREVLSDKRLHEKYINEFVEKLQSLCLGA